jgi:GAF domain-containing protein
MASQVAISLDNARLFQETNQNLQEMRNIQKQYLHDAWIDASLPGEEMNLTVGSSGSVENIYIEVPISIREQVIGHIHLEGEEEFTSEDQIWLQAIATQTAFALENARLLDEAQRHAARERIIGDISANISNFSDLDGILRTAVQKLGQRLGGAEVVLELGNKKNGSQRLS